MRFSYSYSQRYSEGNLIKMLQDFEKKHKRPPRMEDADRTEEMANSSTFTVHFGSWNKALDAAGVQKMQWKYTDDELLDKFLELRRQLGRIPTKSEMEMTKDFPAVRSFVARFGCWEKAVELALERKFKRDSRIEMQDAESKAEMAD